MSTKQKRGDNLLYYAPLSSMPGHKKSDENHVETPVLRTPQLNAKTQEI